MLGPRLLAGCLRASGTSTVRAATSLSRSDLRRISLPLLPIDEQHRLGAAFAGFAGFDEALRRCAASGDTYLQAAAADLAEGRIGPEP